MRLKRVLPILLIAASTYAHAALKPGCQYFTQQDAAALVGEPVKPGMDFGQPLCNFPQSAKGVSIQAGVRPGQGNINPVNELDDIVRGYNVSHVAVTPISGLGDRAIVVLDPAGNLTLFAAAKGSLVMVILREPKALDSPARRDAMIKAARTIISRL
jgi:hypothetical protein